jgi:hypothetical protein
MGADEPFRLAALHLRDDQNTGDARGGVGHAARAGRQGMATAARVADLDGPRWLFFYSNARACVR